MTARRGSAAARTSERVDEDVEGVAAASTGVSSGVGASGVDHGNMWE